jgi:hypothetical protein
MPIIHGTCDTTCREEEDFKQEAIENFLDGKQPADRPELIVRTSIPILSTKEGIHYPHDNKLDAVFAVSMIVIVVVQYHVRRAFWH